MSKENEKDIRTEEKKEVEEMGRKPLIKNDRLREDIETLNDHPKKSKKLRSIIISNRKEVQDSNLTNNEKNKKDEDEEDETLSLLLKLNSKDEVNAERGNEESLEKEVDQSLKNSIELINLNESIKIQIQKFNNNNNNNKNNDGNNNKELSYDDDDYENKLKFDRKVKQNQIKVDEILKCLERL